MKFAFGDKGCDDHNNFITAENLFMKWIDLIPMRHLVLASLMLGLAPFVPEPHLVEKAGMLFAGSLTKPIDIFDLFLHGTPSIILFLKIFRGSNRRAEIKK